MDIGHVLAGPFAGTMLADLGADVIKVENPRTGGDGLRNLGPRLDGVPLWWKVAGRNKRSISLDLATVAHQNILLRLARVSDVVIENYRPGTLERWGIGPAELREANPKLVLLRISGFGQGDPRPGFGRVGEAMSGVVNLTGERDGRPFHVGFSLGDTVTGLMGALGVLAALLARQQTARGDVIDLALYESLFRMVEWQIPMAAKLGRVVQRQGNQFPIGYAVGGSYRTSDDEWVSISAATDSGIKALLRIVASDDQANDPRFEDFDARSDPANLTEIDRLIATWIGARPSNEVLDELRKNDVAVGLVYDAGMMLADRLFWERGSIIDVDDRDLGVLPMPGVVPRLENNPGRVEWAGPRMGEHTREILIELLGMTPEDVDIFERNESQ